MFAYQWASLDVLSGGRMQLAVWTGLGSAAATEGAVLGVPNRARPERLEQYITICRRLWGSESVEYESRDVTYRGASIEVLPVQEPCPIWIAANRRSRDDAAGVADRVSRLADGLMTNDAVPGTIAMLRDELDSALAASGWSPAALRSAAYHSIVVADDEDAALDEAHAFLRAYVGPGLSREVAQAWSALGTPEQCANDLRSVAVHGVDLINLRATSFEQRRQFDRIVRRCCLHSRIERSGTSLVDCPGASHR